jgi:hypothetical protein
MQREKREYDKVIETIRSHSFPARVQTEANLLIAICHQKLRQLPEAIAAYELVISSERNRKYKRPKQDSEFIVGYAEFFRDRIRRIGKDISDEEIRSEVENLQELDVSQYLRRDFPI